VTHLILSTLIRVASTGMSELKVIIGAGHHSGPEGVKIGPAIKKMVEGKGLKWRLDDTNKSGGAIIVSL